MFRRFRRGRLERFRHAINDQAHPTAVLRNIHRALRPGATFLMVDIKASSAYLLLAFGTPMPGSILWGPLAEGRTSKSKTAVGM